MKIRAGGGTILTIALLACLSSSAAALPFAQAPESPYPTTNPPSAPSPGGVLGGIASGDFNGDGISDVAVVNSTGLPVFSPGESVSVLLGSRSGGLTIAPGSPIEIYSGGMFSASGAIVSGDFNHDGKLDLAVVDELNQTVTILLGSGTGQFHQNGAAIPFAGSGSPSIAVGDFNGDGKQDLAVANSELTVLLGNGSGGFDPTSGSPFTLPGYASAIAAGEFTGDGRSDLAVADDSGNMTIYLSKATGDLQAASTLTDLDPTAIATAKLTPDGHLDLVTANATSDDVTVLLGNGSGGFTPASGSPFAVPAGPGCNPVTEAGLPESIALGDFNQDGNPDIAVANFNGCSNSVAVLLGDGQGQFSNAPGSPYGANTNPREMAVGDFNGDGDPDLAVVNPFHGTVTVLQNTPEAPPAPSPPLPAPSGNGGGSQPGGYHPNAPLHHGRSERKPRKCSTTIVRHRHGRKIRIQVRSTRCPKRHSSAPYKHTKHKSRR